MYWVTLLMLKSPFATLREQAVKELGTSGNSNAVEPLLAALLDASNDVREAAANALGTIGDLRAIAPLVTALGDRHKLMRWKAASALEAIGWQPVDETQRVLYAIAREKWQDLVSMSTTAVEPLIEALKNQDGDIREKAAWVLGQIRDIRAEEPLLAVLKDQNSGIQGRAAEALGQIGDTRAVESLITALKDENNEIRRIAAQALGQIGDPQAVEPLLSVLKDQNSGIQGKAAEVLGQIGDPRAVEPLIAALEDENNEVRQMAAQALGQLGDSRAVEPLVTSLRSPYQVQKAAAEALVKIGNAAVEPLIAALEDQDRRYNVARALGQIGDARAAEPLILALEDRKMWIEAAEALGMIGDTHAVEPLVEVFIKDYEHYNTDDSYDFYTRCIVRDTVEKALDKIDPNWTKFEVAQRIVPALLTALIDERSGVRLTAKMTLEKICPDWMQSDAARETVPVFAAALVHEDLRVSEDAEEVLKKIDPNWAKFEKAKAAIPSLVAALRDRNYYTEKVAVEALVKFGNAAVEPLIAALEDQDRRYNVARALGQIGDARAAEPLVTRLKHDAHQEVVDALIKIGNAAVEPLIAVLKYHISDVRRRAIEALGQIGDARAVEPLIAVLKDQDIGIRMTTAEALGQIADKRAIKPLVALLKDNYCYVRHPAAKALDSLGWQPQSDAQCALRAVALENWDEAANFGMAAINAFLVALKDDSPSKQYEIQKKAQEALKTKIGNASIEPLIRELKKINTNDRHRRPICEALALFGKASIPRLVRELTHDDSNVRANATHALGLMGTTALEILPNLIECLSDPELRVRRSAAEAIGNLGPEAKEAVPHLIKVWCIPDEFDYSSLNVIDKMKIEDPRIINPLLQYLFSSPHENRNDAYRKAHSVLTAVVPCSALTKETVPLILEAACFEHWSSSYEHDDINVKASDAAIQQLCALKLPVTNNVLHLITQKRDVSVTIYAGCGGGGSWEEKVSFQNQRVIAQAELKKRGDPQYQPEVYLKLLISKRFAFPFRKLLHYGVQKNKSATER